MSEGGLVSLLHWSFFLQSSQCTNVLHKISAKTAGRLDWGSGYFGKLVILYLNLLFTLNVVSFFFSNDATAV